MRHLWKTTFAMVGGGAALIAASLAGGLGPIPLVSGVLLLWSGIVKVIVLRIWHHTLTPAEPPEEPAPRRPALAGGTRPR